MILWHSVVSYAIIMEFCCCKIGISVQCSTEYLSYYFAWLQRLCCKHWQKKMIEKNWLYNCNKNFLLAVRKPTMASFNSPTRSTAFKLLYGMCQTKVIEECFLPYYWQYFVLFLILFDRMSACFANFNQQQKMMFIFL